MAPDDDVARRNAETARRLSEHLRSSIYVELRDVQIGYRMIHVLAVPRSVRGTGPGWEWLPDNPAAGTWRVIFWVVAGTPRGTPRNPAEYAWTLLQLSEQEYLETPWARLRAQALMELYKRDLVPVRPARRRLAKPMLSP